MMGRVACKKGEKNTTKNNGNNYDIMISYHQWEKLKSLSFYVKHE